MMSDDELSLVEACEERIINCWPAVDTLLLSGFAVRFANGYSGRANSASPLRRNIALSDNEIEIIERAYNLNALPSCFRATVLMAQEMRNRLDRRGYRIKDSSFGMITDLPAGRFERARGMRVDDKPGDAWLAGVSRLQKPDKSDPAHLKAILGRLQVPAFFLTYQEDGRDLGFGYTAVDRGMAEIASIILAPEARGKGVGRKLVETLLALASEAGAQQAFLQVDQTNSTALTLYQKTSFRVLYSYDTLVLDTA
jgi:ribosomal protein S18 acetylase RimI-like enzyme